MHPLWKSAGLCSFSINFSQKAACGRRSQQGESPCLLRARPAPSTGPADPQGPWPPAGVCQPANAPTAADSQEGLGLEGISLAMDPVRPGERRSLWSLTHSGHPKAETSQAWTGRQAPPHGPGQPWIPPPAHTSLQPLKLPKGPFSWRLGRAGRRAARRAWVIAYNRSSGSLCSLEDCT